MVQYKITLISRKCGDRMDLDKTHFHNSADAVKYAKTQATRYGYDTISIKKVEQHWMDKVDGKWCGYNPLDDKFYPIGNPFKD